MWKTWQEGPKILFRGEVEPKKGRNSNTQASNPMETRPKKYDRDQRGEKRVSSGERECRIEKHRDF